jgi:hypothetical protein
MGKMVNAFRVLVGKLRRDQLEALGIDGRVILKWFLKMRWESVGYIHLA